MKPQFFKNENLADLPFEHRLCFAGLWTQADKAGRLEDRPKRLKAELFPYDDVNLDAMLHDLAAAGFVTRYQVDGQSLIAVVNFQKHQRPRDDEPASTLPGPSQASQDDDPTRVVGPSAEAVTSPSLHSDSTVSAQCLGKERDLEKGNGEGSTPRARGAAVDERFERFWASYPKKVGKDAALNAFRKRKPDQALVDRMVEAIELQKHSVQWQRDGGQYVPNPATWINQGRWQDEVQIGVNGQRRPAPTARQLEEAKALYRRWGRCEHDPKHDNWRDCVEAIVWSL